MAPQVSLSLTPMIGKMQGFKPSEGGLSKGLNLLRSIEGDQNHGTQFWSPNR